MQAATGLTAIYEVSGDGRSVSAEMELENADTYFFFEPGLLGERVPVDVQHVTLSSRDGLCDPCNFTREGSIILFERGNYTLRYRQEIRENHFIAIFDRPYDVKVVLSGGLDVRNRFIGSISQGGVAVEEDGRVAIYWNNTRLAECRFYEPFREFLLMTFFMMLCIVAIVLLVPFLLMERRRR